MPRSSLSAAREQTSRSPSTFCTYVVRSYPTLLSVDAGPHLLLVPPEWCRKELPKADVISCIA